MVVEASHNSRAQLSLDALYFIFRTFNTINFFLDRSQFNIQFSSIDSETAGIKIVIIYFNIFISFAFPSLHDYVLAPYSRI